jgi:hypothetical protein
MVSGSPQPQTALGELLRELKASTGLTLKELTRLPQLAAVFCNFEQFWRRK